MQKEISKINKNKAIGKDNLSFKPIDNKQCLSMKNDQDMDWYEYSTRKVRISKACWKHDIEWNIAGNLTTYVNHCI